MKSRDYEEAKVLRSLRAEEPRPERNKDQRSEIRDQKASTIHLIQDPRSEKRQQYFCPILLNFSTALKFSVVLTRILVGELQEAPTKGNQLGEGPILSKY